MKNLKIKLNYCIILLDEFKVILFNILDSDFVDLK